MAHANRGESGSPITSNVITEFNDRPVGTEPPRGPISTPLDGLKTWPTQARLRLLSRVSARRRLAGALFCPHRLIIFRLEARIERLTRALREKGGGALIPVILLVPSMLLGAM